MNKNKVIQTKPFTLLIVEDNYLTLHVEKNLFKQMGCHILTAQTGEEALRLLNATIDVVLTDIDISDGRGDALAKAMHLCFPNLPIFGFTSQLPHIDNTIDQTHLMALFAKPLSTINRQTLLASLTQCGDERRNHY